jgi:hypothetical protein
MNAHQTATVAANQTQPPSHLRAGYIDADTLDVITHALDRLAESRIPPDDRDPHTDALDPADLLHLLASLTLQAQTWMHHAIEETLLDEESPLTPNDITHILAGARPDPTSWPHCRCC